MSALAESWDDLDDDLAFSQLGEVPEDGASIDTTLADRMLRRVLRERRALQADEAVAQAQIDQVNAWLDRRRAAHDTAYLEECLRQFHEALLVADPKAKTLHLPSGRLVARKQPDRWVFDEDAFIEWATAERSDLLRPKVEIDKPAAKQALFVADDGRVLNVEGGEYVAAVAVERGEVGFSIKPGEADQ